MFFNLGVFLTSMEKGVIYTPQEQQRVILPLLKKLHQWHQSGKTLVVGIQGGQGTGKTTLVRLLEEILHSAGYAAVSFSLDDFYTPWKERRALQQKYPHNPFYHISRGLPGTHRVQLLKKVLGALKRGKNAEIPRFDKSLHQGAGDVLKKKRKIRERQDFVLFEGWCVGIPPLSASELQRICRKQGIPLDHMDPTGKHQQVVLRFLKHYQPAWAQMDRLIQLQPDSSGFHLQWRLQQEKELREKKRGGMSPQEVKRFTEPYLPFTYACYEKVKPDVKILINKEHTLYAME